MKHKPLVFIVLGLLHFCEPVFKVLYFKLSTGLEFETIMSNIFQMGGVFKLIEFWLLFPLAGMALWSVKKWGYPLFVSIQVYSVWQHLTYDSYTWPYVTKNPHFFSLIILSFNVMVILYFLLPDVRRPFFDKEMRWWEHRMRYNLPIPACFTKGDPDKIFDAEILNISHSGAFMAYNSWNIEVGDLIRVVVSYAGESLELESHVVSRHKFRDTEGVGIKFNYQNIWEKLAMARIIKQVARESKKRQAQKIGENQIAA